VSIQVSQLIYSPACSLTCTRISNPLIRISGLLHIEVGRRRRMGLQNCKQIRS